jgi:hypothetical protein
MRTVWFSGMTVTRPELLVGSRLKLAPSPPVLEILAWRDAGVGVGAGGGVAASGAGEGPTVVGMGLAAAARADGLGEANTSGGKGGRLAVGAGLGARAAERAAFRTASPPTSNSSTPITAPARVPHQRALRPRRRTCTKERRHHSQLSASRGFLPPQPGQRIIIKAG